MAKNKLNFYTKGCCKAHSYNCRSEGPRVTVLRSELGSHREPDDARLNTVSARGQSIYLRSLAAIMLLIAHFHVIFQ